MGAPLQVFFKPAVRMGRCCASSWVWVPQFWQCVTFLPEGVTLVTLVAWGVELVDVLAADKLQESNLMCSFVDVEATGHAS